jgi:hypothetical protein
MLEPQSDPRDIHGIDPAFAPYVKQFEDILGRSIGDIPIQFGPQNGDVIGVCVVWNSAWREIKIDPNYWKDGAYDNDERMSLIFHELGHCVLNRGHLSSMWTYTNNQGPWSVPVSFMNPYVFFSDYPPYLDLKSYYINELFHPAPGYPTLNESAGELDDVVHMESK